MADVDPRLGPFIDTLISSGADWLALEILSAIRMGQPEEHSQQELDQARHAVQSFRKREGAPPPQIETRQASIHHLTGDEQLQFAVDYTIERITQNVEMAQASIRLLNEVASRSIPAPMNQGVSDSEAALIELGWTDTEERLSGPRGEEVSSKLPVLRSALFEWLKAVREGAHNQ